MQISEERFAALELAFQEQREVIELLKSGVQEFREVTKRFAEVCEYEIELHEAGLRDKIG